MPVVPTGARPDHANRIRWPWIACRPNSECGIRYRSSTRADTSAGISPSAGTPCSSVRSSYPPSHSMSVASAQHQLAPSGSGTSVCAICRGDIKVIVPSGIFETVYLGCGPHERVATTAATAATPMMPSNATTRCRRCTMMRRMGTTPRAYRLLPRRSVEVASSDKSKMPFASMRLISNALIGPMSEPTNSAVTLAGISASKARPCMPESR